MSNTGTWMQRVAQDWLVLQLTGNSGTALGITTGLQFLPVLLLSPYAGVVADRFPKRRLLQLTNVGDGAARRWCSACSPSPASPQVWHVYVLAFVLRHRRRPSTPRPASRSSPRWSTPTT